MAKAPAKPTRAQRIAAARRGALTRNLGPDAAAGKMSMTPKAWKSAVKSARARGLTMQGYFSNAPTPLKERDPKSLRTEAASRISAAYAGDFKAVDREEAGVRSLAEKRATDNEYYTNWLRSNTERLQSDARVANSLMVQQQAAIAQTVAAGAGGIAQQTAGGVSGLAGVKQPTGTSEALAAESARSSGVMTAAQQKTQALSAQNEARTADLGLLAQGFSYNAERGRQGDLAKGMGAARERRQGLEDDRRGDTVKEESRLLDIEREKAQGNRDYAAAAQKLGIDEFKAVEGVKTERSKLRAANAKSLRDYRRDMAVLKENKRKNNITAGKYAAEEKRLSARLSEDKRKNAQAERDKRDPNAGGGRGSSGGKPNTREAKLQHNRVNLDSSISDLETVAGNWNTDKPKGYKAGPVSYFLTHQDEMIRRLVRQGYGRRTATRAVKKYINDNRPKATGGPNGNGRT